MRIIFKKIESEFGGLELRFKAVILAFNDELGLGQETTSCTDITVQGRVVEGRLTVLNNSSGLSNQIIKAYCLKYDLKERLDEVANHIDLPYLV